MRRFVGYSLSFFIATTAFAPQAIYAKPKKQVLASTTAKPYKNWQYGAMISAANPYAVDAGLEILARGGSAVDAAIAVQTALGLVEPQSSGIGGGGFMIYYDAKSGKVTAFDGREKAPMGASPDMFMENGKPFDFWAAVKSGRSTGTPGAVAMLHLAWSKYGKLSWGESFEPAIKIAETGFPMTERMHEEAIILKEETTPGEGAQKYLYDENGVAYEKGRIFKNPEYAQSLRAIAKDYRVLYEGYLAEEIVAKVAQGPIPGTLSMADMKTYSPQELPALCKTYKVHLVCGMPPPSSGGVGTIAAMEVLENFDMKKMGNTAKGWHYLIEAQRLAYIDRDTYVADPAFVDVPTEGLLDKAYIKTRAALISPVKAMTKVEAGNPKGSVPRGKDQTGGVSGTSHFVIVDKEGNVVSMTTTVENLFGSQRMVGGFFLNNQLTDFSFLPTDSKGMPVVNSVAAGKKPRSSMSPTIVFDKNGHFEMAVGSPGGNAIIAYVTKSLVGMLDWGLTPQQAIDLPNVVARREPAELEYKRFRPDILKELEGMNHQFKSGHAAEASGLHAIMLTKDGLVGGADSRREGVAKGLK